MDTKTIVLAGSNADRQSLRASLENVPGSNIQLLDLDMASLATVPPKSVAWVVVAIGPSTDSKLLNAACSHFDPHQIIAVFAQPTADDAALSLRLGALGMLRSKTAPQDIEKLLNAADAPGTLAPTRCSNLSFTVDGNASSQGRAAQILEDFLTQYPLPSSQIVPHVVTCCYEALANALEHGHKGDENLPIDIDFSIHDAILQLSITHHGDRFDPSSIPTAPPEPDPTQLGGRGLLIMRAFMDDVWWERDGRQCVSKKSIECHERKEL